MRKFDRPPGLIRYDTSHALSGGATSTAPARPRLIVYPLMLVGLLTALLLLGKQGSAPELTLLRGIGSPFRVQGSEVQNQVRIKIQNRSSVDEVYLIELGDSVAQLIAPQNPLPVPAGQRATAHVFILSPVDSFEAGKRDVKLVIREPSGRAFEKTYRLLGPRSQEGK